MFHKLKKFIAKQKVKFGTTGPGQQLNSETPAPSSSLSKSGNSSSKDVCVPSKRKELSSEAKAAALARIEGRDKKELNTSLAAIQALVRRELEVERKVKRNTGTAATGYSTSGLSENERKDLAVQGVYFRYPREGTQNYE
ncbi:uncharacterized protein LOC119766992 [Culex quinquefasciatus]|uniref:uncharacterized protein LOC119766992 n=1 Tax=Culex quinquefasciatus TaxID=7176 RepID=UPI0018E3BC22|nr:uncharacterized protein LOC119766992 [Culex quinquefasciatus]XP_039435735.1 uncharacterized protein LOC120417672 [Culex pipiens pallens]XP_039435736.1 uncharacterized protein LOC120417673 [Culex pipiens pallens]